MSLAPDRPSRALQEAQAAWLAPLRSRALRRGGVAHRRVVLDLGAGEGAVTVELLRRCGGGVTAVDRVPLAVPGATCVQADAAALPFANAAFDLVFTQLALMWMPLPAVLDELRRVLAPGGALVAIEPDYGGLVEHPPQTALRPLWEAGLRRAGADPHVGRALPGALAARGFTVEVLLPSGLAAPAPERFELLAGLPLQARERQELEMARAAAATLQAPWAQLAALPMLAICATPG